MCQPMSQFEVWGNYPRNPNPILVVQDCDHYDPVWGYWRFLRNLPPTEDQLIYAHHEDEYRSGLDRVEQDDD
jgi:hypothetical protein